VTWACAAVEEDRTGPKGDECKFGGGKVIREGMGQACGVPAAEVLDVVITNALVLDYTGIYKADVGIKGGLIVGLGKAGNPDVMAGVTPGMTVGVNTDVIAGEGHILTAGTRKTAEPGHGSAKGTAGDSSFSAAPTHTHESCRQVASTRTCTTSARSSVTTLSPG
jgi:hypothetical protein